MESHNSSEDTLFFSLVGDPVPRPKRDELAGLLGAFGRLQRLEVVARGAWVQFEDSAAAARAMAVLHATEWNNRGRIALQVARSMPASPPLASSAEYPDSGSEAEDAPDKARPPRLTRSDSAAEAGPSPVLHVHDIDELFTNAAQLFAVFALFGAVDQILFMKNIRKAMIEFKTLESASKALAFFAANEAWPFNVCYSKYSRIQLPKDRRKKISKFNEFFRPDALSRDAPRAAPSLALAVSVPRSVSRAVLAASVRAIVPDACATNALGDEVRTQVVFEFERLFDAMKLFIVVSLKGILGVPFQLRFCAPRGNA